MVGAAAIASFVAFGVLFSFGVFVEEIGDEFDVGKGPVAALFSVAAGLYYLSGGVAGRLGDRYGPRPVLLGGSIVLVAGLWATAVAPSLLAMYLGFGLLVGPGVACCYAPMVAAAGGWFDEKRTLAMGTATAGVGIGTLVMAPVGSLLVSGLGWRGAMGAYAVGSAVLLSVAIAGAYRPPPASGGESTSLRPMLQSHTFLVMFSASTLLSFAFYTPFVFLPTYAEEVGIDASVASVLVGLIGAMSVASRILFGLLGGHVSPTALYKLSYVLVGVSYLFWLGAGSSLGMLLGHVVVMGVGYGGFVAIGPAVLADSFGVSRLGGLIGALYTSWAIGGFFGPSSNGFLIDRYGFWAALLMSLGAMILAIAMVLRLRP